MRAYGPDASCTRATDVLIVGGPWCGCTATRVHHVSLLRVRYESTARVHVYALVLDGAGAPLRYQHAGITSPQAQTRPISP